MSLKRQRRDVNEARDYKAEDDIEAKWLKTKAED